MSVKRCLVAAILTVTTAVPLFAQTPEVEFFEAKIRPVLA